MDGQQQKGKGGKTGRRAQHKLQYTKGGVKENLRELMPILIKNLLIDRLLTLLTPVKNKGHTLFIFKIIFIVKNQIKSSYRKV